MNRIRDLSRILIDGQEVYHNVPKDGGAHTAVAKYNLTHNTLIGLDGTIYSGKSPLNKFTTSHYTQINPQRVKNNNAYKDCYVIWNEKHYNMDEWFQGPLQSFIPRNI